MKQIRVPSLLILALMTAACASQNTSDKDYAGQGQVVRDCPPGQMLVCSSKTPGRKGEDGSTVQSYDSCICRIRQ